MERMNLAETVLGVGVFPEFPAIMEQDACNHQVSVQLRVDAADDGCRAHHLGHVLDQPAAPRMVVFPRRRRPAEAVAHRFEKMVAEFFQARIGDLAAKPQDLRVIGLLFPTQRRIPREEIRDRLIGEQSPAHLVAVDAPLVLRPLTLHPYDGLQRQLLRLRVQGRVRPNLQAQRAGRVRENEIEIRLPALRRLHRAGLELRRHRCDQRHVVRLFLEAGNGDQTHARRLSEHGSLSREYATQRATRLIASKSRIRPRSVALVFATKPLACAKWTSPSAEMRVKSMPRSSL